MSNRVVVLVCALVCALLALACGDSKSEGDKSSGDDKTTGDGSAAPTRPLDGPVTVTLGDCANPETVFESGPRPGRFDRYAVSVDMSKRTERLDQPKVIIKSAPKTDDDLATGKMGRMDSTRQTGQYAMKRDDADPATAKQQVLEQARESGILGVLTQPQGGAFASLTGTATPAGMLGDDGDEDEVMPSAFRGGVSAGTLGKGSSLGSSGYGYSSRRPSSRSQIRIGMATVSGDLDKNIIRRYVRRKLARIRNCYDQALETKPGVEGMLVVQFRIDPDGSTKKVVATGEDMPTELGRCTASVFKSIKFPKPRGGGAVNVRYPLRLSPPPSASSPGSTASPSSSAPVRPAYRPGSKSPFAGKEKALEACFRKQTARRAGVLVAEIASVTDDPSVTIHGWGDKAVDDCVASLLEGVKPAKPVGDRCPVAFGPLTVGELPGIDINGAVTLTERWRTPPVEVTTAAAIEAETSWRVAPLADKLERWMRVRRETAPKDIIWVTGPFTLRPAPATSMKVVMRVMRTVRATNTDVVLAAAGDKEGIWRFLPRRFNPPADALPIAPMPLGMGHLWSFRGVGLRSMLGSKYKAVGSVLVGPNAIVIGHSGGAPQRFAKSGTSVDLVALKAALEAWQSGAVAGKSIEVASQDTATYADFTAVIDLLHEVGYTQWMVVAPERLSTRLR